MLFQGLLDVQPDRRRLKRSRDTLCDAMRKRAITERLFIADNSYDVTVFISVGVYCSSARMLGSGKAACCFCMRNDGDKHGGFIVCEIL